MDKGQKRDLVENKMNNENGESGPDYMSQLSAAETSELIGNLNSIVNLEVQLMGEKPTVIKLNQAHGNLMEVIEGHWDAQLKSGPMEMTFVLNLSKYLLRTHLKVTDLGRYFVELNGSFFLVQRRKNFRVSVPIHLVSRASFTVLQRPEKDYLTKLVNISLGGCLLMLESSGQTFRPDEMIELTLTLEGGKIIPLKAFMRRIMSTQKEGRVTLHLGIEFDRLNSFEESRVNEIVMKSYRLTHRFSNRLKDK